MWILFVILQSCAHSPPDEIVCLDLGDKGFCTRMISDQEFYVEGSSWETMKRGSVLMPATSYAEIKKYLLIQCKRDSRCDINLFEKKMEILDANSYYTR